jgi:atypical dual specificity phosphatase
MKALTRAAARLAYYPSVAFNGLMCGLGLWNKWDAIDASVLLGIVPSERDLDELHGLGVRSVVNLCKEFTGHGARMAVRGMEQLHLPTLDFCSPTAEDIERGVRYIGEARGRGKVYVHCKAGRGRSATVALCYLMASRGWGIVEAYAHLRAARPHVDGGLDRREAVRLVEARVAAGELRLGAEA